MPQRYNTGNQRPSNSMKDVNDNALAFDDYMNSDSDTFVDRLENERDSLRGTIKKILSEGESAVGEARQNLIPLSRQYMTLEAAQADIANIPEGSTTYVRSPDDSALAVEYINNAGTLQPTGRKMPSQQAVGDIEE
ncbi:GDSL family lipase, partial [Klebsiella variicola]